MKSSQNSFRHLTRKKIIFSALVVMALTVVAGAVLKTDADTKADSYMRDLKTKQATYVTEATKLNLSDYIHRNNGDDSSFAPEERAICDNANRLLAQTKKSTALPASMGGFLSSKYQDAKQQGDGIPLGELESYGRYCNFYVLDTERRYEVDKIMASEEYKAVLSDCNGQRRCIAKENYSRMLPYQEKIVATIKGYYEKQRDSQCPFSGKESELCEPYVTFEKEVLDLWQRYHDAMKAGDSQGVSQISAEFGAKGPLVKLDEVVKRVVPSVGGANDFYGKRLKEIERKISVVS